MARRAISRVKRTMLGSLRGGVSPSDTRRGWYEAFDVVPGKRGSLAWRGAKRVSQTIGAQGQHAAGRPLGYHPNLLRSDMCNVTHSGSMFSSAAWPPIALGSCLVSSYAAGVLYQPTGWAASQNYTWDYMGAEFGDEVVAPSTFGGSLLSPGTRFCGNTTGSSAGYGSPAATLAVTLGSATITASAAMFNDSSWVGRYIRIRSGATLPRRWYKIVSITSTTAAVVDVPVSDTAAAAAWDWQISAPWLGTPGTFGIGGVGGTLVTPANNGDNAVAAALVEQHDGRPVCADVIDLRSGVPRRYPESVRWGGAAADGGSAAYPEFRGHERFELGAYQDVYPGEGGGRITALKSYSGVLFIFKPYATYVMRGAMHVDGIDLGMSIDRVSQSEGVDFPSQVCVTDRGLVVAGPSGVLMYSGSGPQRTSLSDPIQERYVTLISSGYGVGVSYLPRTDRLVVAMTKGTSSGGYPTNEVVLVYHFATGEWFEQRSSSTSLSWGNPLYSNVVTIPGITANSAFVELSTFYDNEGATYGGWADWRYDMSVPLGLTPQSPPSAQHAPYPRLVSHAVELGGGAYSGRVRAMLVDAHVPTGSGPVSAGVLTGSLSDSDTPSSSVSSVSLGTGLYDYQQRLPLRSGTQVLSSARIVINCATGNTGGFGDGGIRSVGMEVADVNRIR